MFGMMHGHRAEVTGDVEYNYITVRDSSVRGVKPDVNAMATVNDTMITVLVWNYHDLNTNWPDVRANIQMVGIDAEKVILNHFRVDLHNSNSYEAWKKMGSPQNPTPEQYQKLEEAGKLHELHNPQIINIKRGQLTIPIELPGQAVSLLVLKAENNIQ